MESAPTNLSNSALCILHLIPFHSYAKRISSHEVRHHIEDISPVLQGTDIIVGEAHYGGGRTIHIGCAEAAGSPPLQANKNQRRGSNHTLRLAPKRRILPTASAKNNARGVTSGIIFWCRKRGSNPHGIATTGF